MSAHSTLKKVAEFWADGDCPTELWEEIIAELQKSHIPVSVTVCVALLTGFLIGLLLLTREVRLFGAVLLGLSIITLIFIIGED